MMSDGCEVHTYTIHSLSFSLSTYYCCVGIRHVYLQPNLFVVGATRAEVGSGQAHPPKQPGREDPGRESPKPQAERD